jgi:hypothetical protein
MTVFLFRRLKDITQTKPVQWLDEIMDTLMKLGVHGNFHGIAEKY